MTVTNILCRFDDRRGGESYRPADRPGRSPSRGRYDSRRRSSPRNRSRHHADTWVPSDRGYGRPRSRSPPDYRRRSRTPPFQSRGYGPGPYGRRRSPTRRQSPRREDRIRSPPPSWRSRSPYSEGRSRDVSWGRSSPRRTRDGTPGSQDVRAMRRNTPTGPSNGRLGRGPSPRAQPTPTFRSRSPSHVPRREPPGDMSRDRSSLHSGQASPTHIKAAEPTATSRPSSPALHPERKGLAPLRSRSRSPTRPSLSHRPSGPRPRSPYRNQNTEVEAAATGKKQDDKGRSSEKELSEQPQIGSARFSGSIPTQPRSLGMNHSPPSGPYQGPKVASSQHRGSHNTSLLSAPTRPRRGHGAREGPWTGMPIGRGRGPPATASHSMPSGPRASFTPPVPTGGSYRHSGSRQNSSTSAASSPAPRGPNHLAGLGSIIPGGRTLPSSLDAATEKRLSQLEVDRERLLEQMAETQRSKRAGLRDWDRLDRESSICALKSELAEGHLQRMADESIGGGVLF